MKYDINLIDNIDFTEEDDIEVFSSYELTADQQAGLPREDEDAAELKNILADIFAEKFGESYAKVEALCGISEESFRKYIRPSSKRVIPTVPLAKFCIGAKLTPDEAIELFELSGRSLSVKRRFDFILLCELENKDDLGGFDKTLIKNRCKSVLSDDSKIDTEKYFKN